MFIEKIFCVMNNGILIDLNNIIMFMLLYK